jgi:DtxR family transcriptional regulator, Mn-dependent transcriptional regulator
MAGDITHTIESYLEAVFELQEIGERVTQARLARWFRVSPPATAEVVKRMEKMGLIELDSERTVNFTDEGRELAANMAVRHRTIERYLVDVLGVAWHLADDEVRKLEPGISEVVFERMRASLGGVERCPHGNPIPGTDAAKRPIDNLAPMDEFDTGTKVEIDRIREDLELDLEMLRYLEEHSLLPGAKLEISDRDPEGAVTVVRQGQAVAVGPALASHVLCVPA